MLIVDDNATNRSILALQAQSWGILPYAYASGQEALEQVQTAHPSGMSPFWICRCQIWTG